jgi:hypothetical protein
VAFTVPGVRVDEWRAGGQSSSEQVLRFTPTTPGPVEIEAVTADGTARHSFVAHEHAAGSLRIDGDPLLVVGQSRELTASGADGATLTWELGGSSYQQPTVVFTPDSAGLVTVTVTTTGGGASSTRYFTAGEDSP